jgi:hypothetical protein
VWIPAHGHIAYRAGKGTGAHGQAIFDLMQMLPKQPDGMFDLSALVDTSKLSHLSERARTALGRAMSNITTTLIEKHYSALIIDEVGAGMFPGLFYAGLVGGDGQLGTQDDPYVRIPGYAISNPKAIKPLLGYVVHSPYVLVRRK